jgi:peptidoglycan/xylan/chitin deacetylase (PgdA/CDA1 family)
MRRQVGIVMRRLTRFRSFQTISLFFIGIVLLSSCSQLNVGVSPKEFFAQERTSLPKDFYSEDYIVHKLRSGETPEILAGLFLGNKGKTWIIEEANRGILFEEGQLVVIPLKEDKGGLHRDGYQVVPVLCYHRFADTCDASLCTPTDLFDRHMNYLEKNGYSVISMADFLDFLNYRHSIPDKAVVITMDDGYSSAYEIAFPILKKHGFTATLFVYTDFVGTSKSAVTWDQLRKMRSAGFEIGSHSLSHCDLTKTKEGEGDEAYLERVRRELLLSKKILDEKLDQTTVYLAFPYGEFNQRLLALCEEAGYRLGFSVKQGGNAFFAHPLNLKREQILRKDMDHFVAKLRTFHEFSAR